MSSRYFRSSVSVLQVDDDMMTRGGGVVLQYGVRTLISVGDAGDSDLMVG